MQGLELALKLAGGAEGFGSAVGGVVVDLRPSRQSMLEELPNFNMLHPKYEFLRQGS